MPFWPRSVCPASVSCHQDAKRPDSIGNVKTSARTADSYATARSVHNVIALLPSLCNLQLGTLLLCAAVDPFTLALTTDLSRCTSHGTRTIFVSGTVRTRATAGSCSKSALLLFSPLNYREVCGAVGKTPEAGSIRPMAARDFMKYLDITGVLAGDADRFRQ